MLSTAVHCWCNHLSSCARSGSISRRIAVMEEMFLSLSWMAVHKWHISTAGWASSSLAQHNLKSLAVAWWTAGLAHFWSCISVHKWWRILNLPRKVYLVMSFHGRGVRGWNCGSYSIVLINCLVNGSWLVLETLANWLTQFVSYVEYENITRKEK